MSEAKSTGAKSTGAAWKEEEKLEFFLRVYEQAAAADALKWATLPPKGRTREACTKMVKRMQASAAKTAGGVEDAQADHEQKTSKTRRVGIKRASDNVDADEEDDEKLGSKVGAKAKKNGQKKPKLA